MQVLTMADAGAVVRTARARRGWSQQQLAQAAGVTREWISRVEGGKRALDLRRYLDVLDALGLEVDVRDEMQGD